MGFITQDVIEMLNLKKRGLPDELVFPGRGGVKIIQISDAFDRAVDVVGLNLGVTDKRMKVVFHTLRHTYASWLVERGESLYTVKELMGHSTLAMTERYSHIGNNTLKNAVSKLDEVELSSIPHKSEENEEEAPV
jgi:integrase